MASGKLRLCFLTRDYALHPPFGGVATYVRQVARWLALAGHDIQVVCVNRQRAPHAANDGPVSVHFVGPRRIRPRSAVRLASWLPGLHDLSEAYNGWDLLENSLGGWAMVRRLSRTAPFDLVECDDYEGLAFWGLWPVHGHRVLLRGHGIIHLDLPFTRYAGARFHHRLEGLCADRADFILTGSRYLADSYRAELNLRHDRIASLAYPFDVRGMPGPGAGYDEPDGQVAVLYVGRIEHRKGSDLLFAAFEQAHRQCAEIRCVLIGHPIEEFPQLLEAFVRSNADWVTYLGGGLPDDEVFRQMARADILVLPSRTDTLPRVLIEAQAAGLPQVATRVGGIPEIVEDGVTGLLVDGDDAPALAGAILKLCLDKDLRSRMAAASRARALARYDLDAVMARQLRVYQAIAAGETPSGALV